MNLPSRFITALVCTLLGSIGHAQINLDFGDVAASSNTQQTELNTSGTISFTTAIANDGPGDVGGTDIFARIVTLTSYNESLDAGHANSGGVGDNMRLNQRQSTQTRYRFSLYEDASFTTLYDPGVSYSYQLVFFDIDGNDNSGNTTIDEVIFYSQAELTYRQNTLLTIDTSSSEYAAKVTGPTTPVSGGVEVTSLNDAQERIAAIFTVDSLNQVEFAYNVTGNATASSTNDLANGFFTDRNMFLDGGSLMLDDGTTTTVPVVPESSTLFLSGMLIGAFVLVRRWTSCERTHGM